MNWKENQRREALALADGQRAVMRCAYCKWSFKGVIREGKRAFRAHRESKHGRPAGRRRTPDPEIRHFDRGRRDW